MAGSLVATLHGNAILDDLDLAYRTLARALLAYRSRTEPTAGAVDAASLDQAVCQTEAVIDLRPAQAACPMISASSERPGELFNNLGHIFVLLQAVSILQERCSLVPTWCAPAQQSSHEGLPIADLEGDGWALEAYGGANVRNNSKLALDLRSLSLVKPTLHRTFLAFRENAYRSIAAVPDWGEVRLRATCSPRQGAPFATQTLATVVGRRHGVVVLETDAIEVTGDGGGL